MKCSRSIAAAFGMIIFFTPLFGQDSVPLPFGSVSSVVYDNDDCRDVYTDEYLLALSHLGEIRLQGIITTYAPNEREYNLFVKGRQAIVGKARASGFVHLPAVMAGTDQRLVRPASNRIEDTIPLNLPASRFIVEQAHRATSHSPLIVVTGGQLTTVANAFLLDPAIANKVIVSGIFGVQQQDYNAGLDAWAWKIVLARFRVFAVPIGPSNHRGTVYLKAAEVPKNRIKSDLPQGRSFFKWMHEKHHPVNGLPAGHDYDGQAAIPLTRPEYITAVKRWRVQGIGDDGNLILATDGQGPIYEAVDAEQSIATAEFWRVMEAAAETLR